MPFTLGSLLFVKKTLGTFDRVTTGAVFVLVVIKTKKKIEDKCVSCLVRDGTASRDTLKRTFLCAFRLAF